MTTYTPQYPPVAARADDVGTAPAPRSPPVANNRTAPHSRRSTIEYTGPESALSGLLRLKKTLPHQLLLRHETAAFVGLTHDSLATVFRRALSEEPRRRWRAIHVLYAPDETMGRFLPWSEGDADAADDRTDELRRKKRASRSDLRDLLSDRTEELRFYELTGNCSFFGSFFGWRDPGGYIHVSPSIWGLDVKLCPHQSYSWDVDDREPGLEYNAYRRGIENLLSPSSPFAVRLDSSGFATRSGECDEGSGDDQPKESEGPLRKRAKPNASDDV